MKAFLICSILGGLGFVAMGLHQGLFGSSRTLSKLFGTHEEVKAPEPARAKFPQALAPAAHGKPVPEAAPYEIADRPHKLVFLKTNGREHPWQEEHANHNGDWCTTKVEEVELIVVVGPSRELLVEQKVYHNAPPVDRYQYDLEAWLVEAKTGAVLARRKFQNRPRLARSREDFATTRIGAPVSYHTVFRWAAEIARHGAPNPPPLEPIVTIVD
ncbi:MAG: hypothetical protein NZO58_05350 [Gemmataceae bacterium]|nr:hypothetical protein [Gemmataceae bacterium]